MLTSGTDIVMDSSETLDEVAAELVRLSDGRRVWLFEGPLGAGKTTLIQHLCKHLGVTDAVHSPTFSLVNEYRIDRQHPVYHFDLYRLKNIQEAYEIGIEEYFYSGHYCFVEWPQVAQPLWPDDCFYLTLKLSQSGIRIVTASTTHLS